MVDSQGNEFFSARAQIGNSSNEREAKAYFSQGVPIKGSVLFESVPQGNLRLLEMESTCTVEVEVEVAASMLNTNSIRWHSTNHRTSYWSQG